MFCSTSFSIFFLLTKGLDQPISTYKFKVMQKNKKIHIFELHILFFDYNLCTLVNFSRSVDMYNCWFMDFAPQAFRDTRIKVTEVVASTLKATNNLKTLQPEILRQNPGILPTLRMCTCPPKGQIPPLHSFKPCEKYQL